MINWLKTLFNYPHKKPRTGWHLYFARVNLDGECVPVLYMRRGTNFRPVLLTVRTRYLFSLN